MSKEDEDQQSASQFNQSFVAAIENAPNGEIKEASAKSSRMIKRKLRENGFWRNIIPPESVSTSDLSPSLENDIPRIIENMEPDSPGAKSIPFNDGPDTAFYRGDKFEVKFNKVTTPEFAKNIQELRTYTVDLRQVITDNSLKDLQTEEDETAIRLVDRIVGSEGGVGAANVQQNFVVNGAITRQSYKDLKNTIEDQSLNNGVFLVNRHTLTTFLGFNRTELGGDKSQDLFFKGYAALDKLEFMGIPHIATIKRSLVPDNVVYQFTEPGYLGRFYILEDVTMYVERKRDMLRFNAEEKIGCTVANVRGVARTRFTG